MKEKIINDHFDTRAKLEKLCKDLGISHVGSRDAIVARIKEQSYSKIVKCIP